MTDVQAVEIQAELRQVKSMVDHTFNVTLNVGEMYLPQVQTLIGWLQNEVGLVIVNGDGINRKETENDKGRKRKVR